VAGMAAQNIHMVFSLLVIHAQSKELEPVFLNLIACTTSNRRYQIISKIDYTNVAQFECNK